MKSVCVYCGASSGRNPKYAEAARNLAESLCERNWALIYGGGNIGIMGLIADAMLELGGVVKGVIPSSLQERELAHPGLSDLFVTASMHERKALMVELSDGFVALPGGLGTLEEIVEVWTWAQLGFHDKPCGLLNIEGYYDSLLAFLDHAQAEEFVKPPHRSMLIVEDQASALLAGFERYEAPSTAKV